MNAGRSLWTPLLVAVSTACTQSTSLNVVEKGRGCAVVMIPKPWRFPVGTDIEDGSRGKDDAPGALSSDFLEFRRNDTPDGDVREVFVAMMGKTKRAEKGFSLSGDKYAIRIVERDGLSGLEQKPHRTVSLDEWSSAYRFSTRWDTLRYENSNRSALVPEAFESKSYPRTGRHPGYKEFSQSYRWVAVQGYDGPEFPGGLYAIDLYPFARLTHLDILNAHTMEKIGSTRSHTPRRQAPWARGATLWLDDAFFYETPWDLFQREILVCGTLSWKEAAAARSSGQGSAMEKK